MNSIENTCCFTGHRPLKKFFDFTTESDIKCAKIKDFIRSKCEELITKNMVTHFISGGALGVDTWAMEIVISLKEQYPQITLECAMPYPGMVDRFPADDQARFARIKPKLDWYNVLENEYTKTCMQDRNEYMVNHAKYLIAIWTGQRSGTGNTVEYAKKMKRTIFLYNPKDNKWGKQFRGAKVDLGYLMDAAILSPDVAARLFSTVEDAEGEGDILAAAPGSGVANSAIAAHLALEKLLRSAPDSPAMRDFLALYLAQVRHATQYIEGLRQGKTP